MTTGRRSERDHPGHRPLGHLAITARVQHHGLIAAECMALTGGTPDTDGVAPCTTVDRIHRAAFVQRGVTVIARAPTLEDLAGQIGNRSVPRFAADRFRIDVHDPGGYLGMTSTQVAVTIADALDAFPDLGNPQHRFVAVGGADGVTFGEVVAASDAGYRRHDDKPWTTSSSLDARFARGLVNLTPDARSILDPCCGAGSIVLEAAALGLEAFAVDWKAAMVGMTMENLRHFGYSARVVRADSRDHVQPADAVVTDLPYGRAIDSNEREIRAIIERAATLAPAGVFVAPTDISTWLTSAGYTDIEVHTVLKRRGFTRWIHRVTSTFVS